MRSKTTTSILRAASGYGAVAVLLWVKRSAGCIRMVGVPARHPWSGPRCGEIAACALGLGVLAGVERELDGLRAGYRKLCAGAAAGCLHDYQRGRALALAAATGAAACSRGPGGCAVRGAFSGLVPASCEIAQPAVAGQIPSGCPRQDSRIQDIRPLPPDPRRVRRLR